MKMPLLRIALYLTLSFSAVLFVSCNMPQTTAVPPNLPLPPVFQDVQSLQALAVDGLSRIYYCVPPSIVDDPGIPTVLTIDAKLPETPNAMTVYRIVQPEVDYEYASGLASRMGFNAKPRQTSYGDLTVYYFSEGQKGLNILSDGSVQYINNNNLMYNVNLPSDAESLKYARDWLKTLGLYPSNILRTETAPEYVAVAIIRPTAGVNPPASPPLMQDKYQSGVRVNFIAGIDGYELAGMGASVLIGEDGIILKADIKIPELEPYTTAALKQPEDAVALFRSYLDSPSDFLQADPACLVDYLWEDMTAADISLKYFCMVSTDNAQPIYAQPIYVLTGKADSTGFVPFYGRVDGLARLLSAGTG